MLFVDEANEAHEPNILMVAHKKMSNKDGHWLHLVEVLM